MWVVIAGVFKVQSEARRRMREGNRNERNGERLNEINRKLSLKCSHSVSTHWFAFTMRLAARAIMMMIWQCVCILFHVNWFEIFDIVDLSYALHISQFFAFWRAQCSFCVPYYSLLLRNIIILIWIKMFIVFSKILWSIIFLMGLECYLLLCHAHIVQLFGRTKY